MSSAESTINPVKLLWLRSDRLAYIDQDTARPRVKFIPIKKIQPSMEPAQDWAEPTLGQSPAILAAVTPDDDWAAAIYIKRRGYYLTAWRQSVQPERIEFPLALPSDTELESLTWLNEEHDHRYVIFSYRTVRGQLEIGMIAVRTEKTSSKNAHPHPRKFKKGPTFVPFNNNLRKVKSGQKDTKQADTLWNGPLVPHPTKPDLFVAGTYTNNGDDRLNFMYLCRIVTLKNGKPELRKQGLASYLDPTLPVWSPDGHSLYLQGRPAHYVASRRSWDNELYCIDMLRPLPPKRASLNLPTPLHYDGSRFPQIIKFQETSYILFVTKMRTAGNNLWALEIPSQSANRQRPSMVKNLGQQYYGPEQRPHQLTDKRHIIARPIVTCDKNRIRIAFVDKNTMEGEDTKGYRVRVLDFTASQWVHLFNTAQKSEAKIEGGE